MAEGTLGKITVQMDEAFVKWWEKRPPRIREDEITMLVANQAWEAIKEDMKNTKKGKLKVQGSKEFAGNILVTVSDNEVRVWVCKDGMNIFRFKALGKVFKSDTDVIIIGNINESKEVE